MKKLILITLLFVSCKKETVVKSNDMKACDCVTITENLNNKLVNNTAVFYWDNHQETPVFKDFCSNATDWIYNYEGTKRTKQVCN